MRLAFLGTPDFAVQSLAAILAAGHEVVCVYSQPPAPRGRDQTLQPRWRGAAPIQRALMAGDSVTGVQIMRMSLGLDEGAVLAAETVRIGPLDTAGTLHDRLAEAGARPLPPTLAAIEAGTAIETPQAAEGVTYAKKIKPAEARIDWARPAT